MLSLKRIINTNKELPVKKGGTWSNEVTWTVPQRNERCQEWWNIGVALKWRLEKKTKSLLVAAQDQWLNADSLKKDIYHITAKSACRLRNEPMEIVNHVVAGCNLLAQKWYKRCNDKVCLNLHWLLHRKLGYNASDEWYSHVLDNFFNETGKPKIVWDFDIQTDRIIEQRRPDIIVHEVEKGE